MSWDLGEIVPLSFTVTGTNNQPADAGQVTVTVTLPDGTTDVHGPLSSSPAGVYGFDYQTVQAGRHGVRWVATGVNASAFADAFTVEPADDGDFVSVADVKQHMRKTDTADDAQLAGFVGAACQMIVDRIGVVSPTAATHTVYHGHLRMRIILEQNPVISVVTVVALPDGTTVPPADPDNNVDGWVLDSGPGVLTHTSRWPGRQLRVTYRAGRSPLPGNIRLAALELASHLWRSSQLNTSGRRPSLSGEDGVIMRGESYALPYRVRELLGLGKNPTDEFLVG
jgi:uncharacterized repeat protein (TIGR01451 family)